MEINLDRPVLTHLFSPCPDVTYNPYLASTIQGHYENIDNVVSLHLDQRPSFINRSRFRTGILKPKAIRIASLHPLINSNICQGSFGSHFQGVTGQAYNVVHSLACNHSPVHGVSEQLSIVYQPFPYLSSRPYGHNGHAAVMDAENIFRSMLRGQNLYIHGSPADGSRPEESRLAADVVRAPQRQPPAGGPLVSHNIGYLPRELLNSKTPSQRPQSSPFKLHTKGSCSSSKCHESQGKQFCLQKRSHIVLKTNRKRFNAPLTSLIKTINGEITTKKKAEHTAESSNKDQTGNAFPESLASKFGWQVETNKQLESSPILADNNEFSFTTNRLPCERKETSCRSSLDDRTSGEEFDKTKIMDTGAVYLKLPGFSEERKSFRCSQCRYLTDRKNNLKRHVVTMHQESSKILECCGVSFPNKAALRDHNSIFHRGGYRCQVCSRNFCRKALLRRHLTVHSGQKDFFCSICGYATSHKSNLERHQKVHAKRETINDALTKSVSIKVGVRLRPAPSISAVTFNSNRQTDPCGAVRLALPGHEAMNTFMDKNDNSLLNSHQTTKYKLQGNPNEETHYLMSQKSKSPLSRTVKDLCKNNVQNQNTVKNIKLERHKVLQINVSDGWNLDKADINVEVAATTDSVVKASDVKSVENKSNSDNCDGVSSGDANGNS